MTTFTVTASLSTSSPSGQGTALQVVVVTGASGTQPGRTASGSGSGSNTLSITPLDTGSLVYGAQEYTQNLVFTPNGSTTYISTVSGFTSFNSFGALVSTSTTASGTPVTLGATNGASQVWTNVLCEIIASGTLAQDASTPALAHATATSVTTASFTPPAGSLLVAIAGAALANTGTINSASVTDTSGLSLTWTQQTDLTTSGGAVYAGIWTAQLPAPVTLTPGSVALQQELAGIAALTQLYSGSAVLAQEPQASVALTQEVVQ